MSTNYVWGVGRRKSSTARVRIRPGAGTFLVNGKEMNVFFPTPECQLSATAPLRAAERVNKFDVICNVDGGGITGQSGAVAMGLARALITVEPTLGPVLRSGGHLTRDARMKERKKYGKAGARRAFQFSKR
ncbi:MAG TPA: 30S ribosomal protein S9 [Planctomycetota bacterium]|nr:30S ribosomal protein S9 [Planctomycetota bacterium]